MKDPELLNDLYVTKNKYFDKHTLGYSLFYPIMGDAILMAKSTEDWMKRRKVLSTAFYKEKLIGMMNIVKDCVNMKVKEWREEFIVKQKKFDMI